MDTSQYVTSEEKLTDFRKQNPNVTTIPKLAKALNITQGDIKDAISAGEAEIIDEYIFAGDSELLINKANPKNAEFIDKRLFELRQKL